MRDNSNDRTVERSYVQKWRFLIREYELVKAKKHTRFRFVQDFYKFHGTNRQTFAKYYNRYRQTGADEALLPLKRGPKWKSRRTLPFIEERVLEQRRKGINRYEIYAILKPTLLSHTPSPSTIYAITKRHGLNRLTKEMQTTKRRIIKTRAGELGHLDSHHLSRDLVLDARRRYYLVSIVDACTRLAWADVVDDLKSLRGCLQSLELVLTLMNEPQIVPQRPDGRTVGDPRPPTPTSQARRPAPYSGPAGGSERHPVFASERMPLADGPARSASLADPVQILPQLDHGWNVGTSQ